MSYPWGSVRYRPSASPSYAYSGKLLLSLLLLWVIMVDSFLEVGKQAGKKWDVGK